MLAERFGEADADAFIARLSAKQIMEWRDEFALREEDQKRAEHEARVQQKMSQRTGA